MKPYQTSNFQSEQDDALRIQIAGKKHLIHTHAQHTLSSHSRTPFPIPPAPVLSTPPRQGNLPFFKQTGAQAHIIDRLINLIKEKKLHEFAGLMGKQDSFIHNQYNIQQLIHAAIIHDNGEIFLFLFQNSNLQSSLQQSTDIRHAYFKVLLKDFVKFKSEAVTRALFYQIFILGGAENAENQEHIRDIVIQYLREQQETEAYFLLNNPMSRSDSIKNHQWALLNACEFKSFQVVKFLLNQPDIINGLKNHPHLALRAARILARHENYSLLYALFYADSDGAYNTYILEHWRNYCEALPKQGKDSLEYSLSAALNDLTAHHGNAHRF